MHRNVAMSQDERITKETKNEGNEPTKNEPTN